LKSIEWAAGLFEGEGSITLWKRPKGKDAWVTQINLSSTDLDVVEEFLETVVHGKIYHISRKKLSTKDIYGWACTKQYHCVEILRSFLPYLCSRRKAAALNFIEHFERKSKLHARIRNKDSESSCL
jgi:hypothetical protein